MSSLFNQDWNGDGEIDALDSAVDMMLIEDAENQSNMPRHYSSTDKANNIIKRITIPLFYLFAFASPILTVVMPFLSGFEGMKDDGVLPGYILCVIITLIELTYYIRKMIKSIRLKVEKSKQTEMNNEVTE